jgi:hypothetical protein
LGYLLANCYYLLIGACSELDKSVQETFHKYLELRGITPKNTQILHEYMISKDRRVFPKAESKDARKNLAFLTKLCGFIKKD